MDYKQNEKIECLSTKKENRQSRKSRNFRTEKIITRINKKNLMRVVTCQSLGKADDKGER